MAFLIDMDMPPNCFQCPIARGDREIVTCQLTGRTTISKENRPSDCPIRDVQELMACYIGENNSASRKRIAEKMCELLYESNTIVFRKGTEYASGIRSPETGELIIKPDDKRVILFGRLLVAMPKM